MIRVYLLDPFEVVLKGVDSYLVGLGDFTIAGESPYCYEALTHIGSTHPDLLITEEFFYGADVFSFIKSVKKRLGTLPIVIYSAQPSAEGLNRFIKIGVKGYISKKDALFELAQAVTTVYRGGFYFSSSVNKDLLVSSNTISKKVPSLFDSLSPTENNVLKMTLAGYTPKEIAFSMKRSVNTTYQHRRRVQKKLGANNLVELITKAVKFGYQ